jgi:hypothetical protein
MGMGVMMKKYGYSWLMNKIDWEAMIFHRAHRSSLLFNTPSLQGQYRQHYRAVRGVRDDFVFVQDICDYLRQLPYQSKGCMKMLQLLGDVCMQSFRKEVFLYLKQHSCDVQMIPQYENRAIRGEVALTWPSLQRILEIPAKGLHVVWGNNMRLRHIDLLFAWLWNWNDGAENTMLGRLHWDRKPYRMLFQQCFAQIREIYGEKEAWTWYNTIKGLFIRSHWMIPYPSRKSFFSRSQDGRLRWWCSVHDGFLNFLSSKRKRPQDQSFWILEPWEIRLLPIDGWDKGESPMDVDVNLAPIPQNLDALISDDSDQQIEDENLGFDRSEEASVEIYSSGLYHIRRYHLRSYLQQHQKNPDMHTNPKWLLTYLNDLLQDVIESRQEELHFLSPARGYRPWQSVQHFDEPGNHITSSEAESENIDSFGRRHTIQIELQTLRKQQRAVQTYIRAYQKQKSSMDHLRHEAKQQKSEWTKTQWEKCQQRFRGGKKRLKRYQAQLTHLSREVNQQVQFQQSL